MLTSELSLVDESFDELKEIEVSFVFFFRIAMFNSFITQALKTKVRLHELENLELKATIKQVKETSYDLEVKVNKLEAEKSLLEKKMSGRVFVQHLVSF